jgi:transitional endoplasmic reticulum ATPase
MDKNDLFVRKMGAIYFLRHFSRYPKLGKYEIEFVCWLLGDQKAELVEFIRKFYPEDSREHWSDEVYAESNDIEAFAAELLNGLKAIDILHKHQIRQFIKTILRRNTKQLKYQGKSDLEKTCRLAKRMFNLASHEIELVTFLFIISTYEAPENLFDIELSCDRFSERRYLANILGLSQAKTARTISRLEQIGIVENYSRNLSLDDDISSLLQNPDLEQISKRYYKHVKPKSIPLEFHFIDSDVISYLQNLVSCKTHTPTHLLFYGPPGTGKTSLANALAVTAKSPIYSIMRDEDNRSENRRSAVVACLNMTNSGTGSIIIVDEADNLLNTANSWQFRGETQDKGWLNDLMEKPGSRIIWITNTTNGIEESVLRRFAYTLRFKNFNCRQRIILFEQIIKSNRVKRFFSDVEIESLAKKYCVTAGSIELAIKKAKETSADSRTNFQRAVHLSLEAYVSFGQRKKKLTKPSTKNEDYTLDGLNLSANIYDIIDQLERFNKKLINNGFLKPVGGLAMLFHGHPGTGKTALAKYLGEKLDKEVLIKSYSDLQSKWLGQGEKNIRDAFLDATEQEAILIIDEADSMLCEP